MHPINEIKSFPSCEKLLKFTINFDGALDTQWFSNLKLTDAKMVSFSHFYYFLGTCLHATNTLNCFSCHRVIV